MLNDYMRFYKQSIVIPINKWTIIAYITYNIESFVHNFWVELEYNGLKHLQCLICQFYISDKTSYGLLISHSEEKSVKTRPTLHKTVWGGINWVHQVCGYWSYSNKYLNYKSKEQMINQIIKC